MRLTTFGLRKPLLPLPPLLSFSVSLFPKKNLSLSEDNGDNGKGGKEGGRERCRKKGWRREEGTIKSRIRMGYLNECIYILNIPPLSPVASPIPRSLLRWSPPSPFRENREWFLKFLFLFIYFYWIHTKYSSQVCKILLFRVLFVCKYTWLLNKFFFFFFFSVFFSSWTFLSNITIIR